MNKQPFIDINVDIPQYPTDDVQTIADALMNEEHGDYAELFPLYGDYIVHDSSIDKHNLRAFCSTLNHLEIQFVNSTGHIGFSPWFNHGVVKQMIAGLPRKHVDSLFQTMDSIIIDYTPWLWLEQFMNGPQLQPVTAATKHTIDSALASHERALMACGARRAKEHLAWRFGILWC